MMLLLMSLVPFFSRGITHAHEWREEGADGETDDGTTRWRAEKRANDVIEAVWFHCQAPCCGRWIGDAPVLVARGAPRTSLFLCSGTRIGENHLFRLPAETGHRTAVSGLEQSRCARPAISERLFDARAVARFEPAIRVHRQVKPRRRFVEL
jgi:hypothetical protein